MFLPIHFNYVCLVFAVVNNLTVVSRFGQVLIHVGLVIMSLVLNVDLHNYMQKVL